MFSLQRSSHRTPVAFWDLPQSSSEAPTRRLVPTVVLEFIRRTNSPIGLCGYHVFPRKIHNDKTQDPCDRHTPLPSIAVLARIVVGWTIDGEAVSLRCGSCPDVAGYAVIQRVSQRHLGFQYVGSFTLSFLHVTMYCMRTSRGEGHVEILHIFEPP